MIGISSVPMRLLEPSHAHTPAMLRVGRGFRSPTSLARRAGVAQGVASRWERGESIRLDSLLALAKAMRLPAERLVRAWLLVHRVEEETAA